MEIPGEISFFKGLEIPEEISFFKGLEIFDTSQEISRWKIFNVKFLAKLKFTLEKKKEKKKLQGEISYLASRKKKQIHKSVERRVEKMSSNVRQAFNERTTNAAVER